MTSRETSAEIERAAADWLARSESGRLSPADQAELDAWLAGDTRRQGAYVRARAAWALLDRGRALSTPDQPAHLIPRRQGIPRRGLLAGGAIAAGLAAAVALRPEEVPVQRVETRFGEAREVPLEDGSVAFLNTATALDVQLRRNLRLVNLQGGEAWFEVAKDSRRPFLVKAGRTEVRAVGTAFSVRREASETVVLVTEGVVELSGAGGRVARLKAGMQATIDGEGLIDLASVAPEAVGRALAWREGWIVLNGETVRQAAADFNRYNTVKLVVEDGGIAAEPLVGRFRQKDPQAFAEAVEVAFGAQVERTDGQILLKAAP